MILAGGVLAVTSRKIFRSAVYLLISLLGIAALYFYLNYEFIAAVQIVVYVGGIVVLIIFSIFLTHGSGDNMPKPVFWRTVFSGLAAVFAAALTYSFVARHTFAPSAQALERPVAPTVKNIGLRFLSVTEYGYILPFEVVSMLLLAALIGCIVIAIKIKTKP